MKRVLVVDDSALVRKILKDLFIEFGFEVDVAKDGEDALQKALNNSYDLITLDLEMPKKDGLKVLKEIMEKKPTRVLMISSYTTKGSELTLKALSLGALDTIDKKSLNLLGNKKSFQQQLQQKIEELLNVPKYAIRKRQNFTKTAITVSNVFTPKKSNGYVLIGASTGGPGLIETIAKSLPPNYPHPLCVVQHMPENFTSKFAARLNENAKIEVVEACNGLELKAAQMIIAKGGKHLHFRKDGTKVAVKLVPNSRKRFFVPSVDEMFLSALEVLDPKSILAVLLTGIGDDGADGMVALKKAGAYTIAESEETAIVYGMPKEAFVRGGTCEVLPFPKIVKKILEFGAENGI